MVSISSVLPRILVTLVLLQAGSGVLAPRAATAQDRDQLLQNALVQGISMGIPVNDEVRDADVGSFTQPVEAMEEAVEQLTFRWHAHEDDMGHLVVEWENTRVEIPIRKTGS